MRRSIPFLVLLLATAACSRADQGGTPANHDSRASNAVADASDAPAQRAADASQEGGPDIGPETAPDVAFSYNYGFRLPSARIAEVQDQHQQLCERYGLARCRITGMTYRAEDADDVEATLTFSVDPAIARIFAHDAVQRVTGAEGTVAESRIEGTDAGGAARSAGRSIDDLQAELRRVEAELLTAGNDRKGQLDYEASQLRAQIAAFRQTRETQQDALARTPIAFRYGSGRFAPGPDQAPTLRETAAETGEGTLYALYVLLRIAIALSPWALLALLGWGAVRLIRRRIRGGAADEVVPTGI
jgi:hypothetical protein